MEFDVDIARALAHLRASDGELGRLIDRAGPFGLTLPDEPSSFAALAEAIVYQQLSPKAAGTIFGRFCALFPGAPSCPTPDQVLAACGSSRAALGPEGQAVSHARQSRHNSRCRRIRSVRPARPSATIRISWMRPRGPSFSSPSSVNVGQLDVHSPQ